MHFNNLVVNYLFMKYRVPFKCFWKGDHRHNLKEE